MGDSNEYILALYDVRGKQDFIFRSKHIKEIIGGSAIISDIFEDYLYPAAKIYRNRCSCDLGDTEAIIRSTESFDREKFMQYMKDPKYVGQVIYDAGGNFFILYKNLKVYQEINKIFSKDVLENTYSLKVISAYIEGVDFDNFKEDRKKLYAAHRQIEAVETPYVPAQVLPFTQVDYSSSLPLYKSRMIAGKKQKLTRESYGKYEKFGKLQKEKTIFDEKILDKLVTEKGRESLLAIIYIDGNNMGAKVKDCLKDVTNYEECICKLRNLSQSIQKNFVEDRKKAIDCALEEKYHDQPEKQKRRFIVQAGDEINFICNARDAFTIVKAYFKDLPKEYSACAGIAIFHSHAPYADAYRIAEECCESGKKKMKRLGMQEANLMDVQYCQAGIGIDLDTIRRREVGSLISKPWYMEEYDVKEKDDNYFTVGMVETMVSQLNKMARTNVKSLAEYAKKDLTTLKMELKRINAHSNKEHQVDLHLTDQNKDPLLDDKKMQKLLYDIVILYDLWFRGGGERDE